MGVIEMNLDSFEKSILSDIKGIKPKSKQRGYARKLVKKLYSGIEEALASGCSYEEIAESILNRNVRISPSTLKKYHLANKLDNSEDIGNSELASRKEAGLKTRSTKKPNETNSFGDYEKNTGSLTRKSTLAAKAITEDNKPPKKHSVLTGASLTDEDYLDDFNIY